MNETENTQITETVKHTRGRKKGYKHSAETRLKMSLSRKGFHMSDETRKKISDARTGKHHTQETINKIIESKHAHPMSSDGRAAISRCATERMKNPEARRAISEAVKRYHAAVGHKIHVGI